MSLNLELKLKVDSHQDFIQKIEKKGIKFVGLFAQKDIYYSYNKGLLKLRIQNGEYQLIKYQRSEESIERWSNYSILLLFGDDIEDYLRDIFGEEIIIEKERTLYYYKHTRIHLDCVKSLGDFIELETVVKEINEKDAVVEFNEVVRLLNLEKNQEIRKSYRDLMNEKLNKKPSL
jgi:predicted adenylyl cyclase CyaB